MNLEFDKILNALLLINHKDITDLKNDGNKFSFKYGGGRFILVKKISADLRTGYLILYHEVQLAGSVKLVEIEDFIIKVTKSYFETKVMIKNHLTSANSLFNVSTDNEGFALIDYENLPVNFAEQFVAKLIKDKFLIFL